MTARRTVLQHGPVWWLFLRPECWAIYAWRAAFFGPCRPLLFGPPWEDCQ
jgi:hypothetical protein